MARAKNGFTGPLSGKVGNLVACTWKGIPYVRSRPAIVKHPNSPSQMAQQMRMKKTMEFLHPLKEFIRLGFGAYTENKSAFNVALSYNMKNALTGEYPDIKIDNSKALVSMGTLPGASQTTVSTDEPGKIKIEWNPQSDEPNAHSYDQGIIVIYNTSIPEVYYTIEATKRDTGIAIINLPDKYQSHELQCYLIFARKELLLGSLSEKNISNSCYCGKISF